MKKEKLTHSELIMVISTAVMAIATVVMMYSGCQQTKIADSMERMARHDEETKLTAAKRQLQRAAFNILFEMSAEGSIGKLQTKEDCVQFARKISEQMDIPDNYYLMQYPEQAKVWFGMRARFATAFLLPHYFEEKYLVTWGTNNYLSTQLTDKDVVKMLDETCDKTLPEFWMVYSNLNLTELISNAPKR